VSGFESSSPDYRAVGRAIRHLRPASGIRLRPLGYAVTSPASGILRAQFRTRALALRIPGNVRPGTASICPICGLTTLLLNSTPVRWRTGN